MARDAGTKTDMPPSDRSPDREEKLEQEGPDSPVGQQQGGSEASADAGRSGAAAEDAPKPKRKRATKKSEGTAAAQTGVDKAGAEAALEGAEVPGPDPSDDEAAAAPAAKPRRSRAKATGDAPAKPRRGRSKKDDETAAAEAPKPAKSARAARRARRAGEPAVTVRATAKFVRSSPRKARLLTDHIKGKSVDEARAILAFSPRSVAEDWRKLLESAVANAENNHDLIGDDLRVLNATADDGPTLKRFRPRAMGRATRIRKRTSHLTITLTPKE
jgi:ribosomal protein L22